MISELSPKQAMNNFQYALMSASAEVSNALTAYHNTSAKLQQLATQADYMARAVDITETAVMLRPG